MLEKMKPIIAEQLNVNEAEIKPETKFKDDLGADSLQQGWSGESEGEFCGLSDSDFRTEGG